MSPATSLLRHAARPVVARSLDATSALRGIASAIVMGPGNVPGEGGAARGAAPTTAAPEASARVASAPLAEGENFKVLFCGDEFPEAYTYSAELLHKEPNMEVSWHPRAEIPRQIRDCHVVVPRMTRLDAGTIAEASKLRLIVQFGVGLEGVDVAAATARGIRVGRIPSADTGNAVSCAEHAIYLALALLRKQKRMQESIQQRRLGQPIGQTIFGKSALIVGYGGIGKALAARLRAFGVAWMGGVRKGWAGVHGRRGEGEDEADGLLDEWGGPESIKEMLPVADLVFLCCQQTTETIGMVDTSFLAAMKKSAILINVARGGLLHYPAINQALESASLAGLGIDVAWQEPIDPSEPLLKHPGVIVTPHIAGVTEVSYRRMAEIIYQTVLQVRDEEVLTHVELVN